ncbi:flagellar hook-basal body complex protein [Candidatus Photodesmus blepharus]|uniref:Flagellar hook-basal body complex protein FliE n=1 Tax=Candidatus Photodesmus blepharonis TaxID=1179155 RepID=A0A084CP04_9GAMM|nr:flagellar hook-basal body complex protein FliE [Candidatus Photodesmus blepharus]KEY91533.1 flagellar hook-basal body complex protein [Candidatus Photodesmus blepharus]
MEINNLDNKIQPSFIKSSISQGSSTLQRVNSNFSKMLTEAINNVNKLQKNSSHLQTSFDRGDKNISLSDVMIARNKSSIAFEATVQIRNKLIEAYKELINMPV